MRITQLCLGHMFPLMAALLLLWLSGKSYWNLCSHFITSTEHLLSTEQEAAAQMFLTWTLICFHVGVRCEELTALKPEVCAGEGLNVSLEYAYYSHPAHGDYFFWYRQDPGKAPEFLLSHSGAKTLIKENVKGVKFEVEKREVRLLLSPAAVSHSAVYHCAVRPTVTANPQSLNTNLRKLLHTPTRGLSCDLNNWTNKWTDKQHRKTIKSNK